MATDTLSMATALEEAGFERRQAVGVTKAVSSAVADLATKDDVESEGERVLDKLTIRVYGALAVCTGLIVGSIAIATAILLRGAG